jgi:LPXTG-motif cell wall-anchored protein
MLSANQRIRSVVSILTKEEERLMRAKLLMIVTVVAMMGLAFAAPASAQDEPSVTADPPYVEAPGEATFIVSGEGFSDPGLFILPCDIPEGDDTPTVDTCDVSNILPVSPDADGKIAETEVTYDIPEGGLAIAISNADASEGAWAVITIGAAMDDEEEVAEEPEENEVAEEELPETGSESTQLAIIGLTIAAGGAMVVAGSRRLGKI